MGNVLEDMRKRRFVSRDGKYAAVVALVRKELEREWMTVPELSEKLGLEKQAIHNAIFNEHKRLHGKGIVPCGKKGYFTLYGLWAFKPVEKPAHRYIPEFKPRGVRTDLFDRWADCEATRR